MNDSSHLPGSVSYVLAEIGESLRTARIRRNDTLVDWAGRLFCSPSTVKRMERGDPSVSFGAYLSAVELIGKASAWSEAIRPDMDEVGKHLESHVRRKRARKSRYQMPFEPITGAQVP